MCVLCGEVGMACVGVCDVLCVCVYVCPLWLQSQTEVR